MSRPHSWCMLSPRCSWTRMCQLRRCHMRSCLSAAVLCQTRIAHSLTSRWRIGTGLASSPCRLWPSFQKTCLACRSCRWTLPQLSWPCLLCMRHKHSSLSWTGTCPWHMHHMLFDQSCPACILHCRVHTTPDLARVELFQRCRGGKLTSLHWQHTCQLHNLCKLQTWFDLLVCDIFPTRRGCTRWPRPRFGTCLSRSYHRWSCQCLIGRILWHSHCRLISGSLQG